MDFQCCADKKKKKNWGKQWEISCGQSTRCGIENAPVYRCFYFIILFKKKREEKWRILRQEYNNDTGQERKKS